MTGSTSSPPSWVSLINDATIRQDITNAIETGGVTLASMQQLFQDVVGEVGSGTLGASRLLDLQIVAANIGAVGASSYVQYVSMSLAFGNANNISYTGGQVSPTAMGNLTAASQSKQLNELFGTWFLGNNDPSTRLSAVASSVSSLKYIVTGLPLYDGTPSITDVNQGNLGDCYLVCGLAEVALQDPGAIEQMIQDNGNGTYGVRFFVNGKSEWVTVDSTVPSYSSNYYQPIFNNGDVYGFPPQDMWVSLVEKAYAEISMASPANQNYDGWAGNSFSSVGDGGWPDISLAQITGASQLTYLFAGFADNNWYSAKSVAAAPHNFSDSTAADTDIQAFNAIVAAFNAHEDVVLSSNTDSYDSFGNQQLMSSHAFSMIGYNSSNYTIELRNPWGADGGDFDETFYLPLSKFVGTLDYFAFDDNVPTIVAPGIVVKPAASYLGSGVTYLSSLITVSDYNGVPVSGLTYTITDEGSVGYLMFSNTDYSNGQSLTVNGALLGDVEYYDGTNAIGVNPINVSVSDGLSTATASFTITVPDTQITANSVGNLTRAQSIAASSLFTVSGTVTSYTIQDLNSSLLAGYFMLNGVKKVGSFTIASTLLSSLIYVGPIAGSDSLDIQANDGNAPGLPVSVNVTGPTAIGPTVSVKSALLAFPRTSPIAMASLITATSYYGLPSSDFTYSIEDEGSAGNFTINGIYDGNNITVNSTQFSELGYVSFDVGVDKIYVEVNDGGAWGNQGVLTITTAVLPTLKVSSINLPTSAPHTGFGSIIVATDSNGLNSGNLTYTISYSGIAGVLELGSVTEVANASFTLSQTQLSQLTYAPGTIGGTDTIRVSVADNYATSATSTFTITSPMTAPPVVTAVPAKASLVVSAPGPVSLSELFTAADPNPYAAITQYEFDYVAAAGSSGGFLLGGSTAPQASSVGFFVAASDLSTVEYQIQSGTQTLYMRANDGTGTGPSSTAHWGLWATVTVTAPSGSPVPVIKATSTTLSSAAATTSLSSLVSFTDPNGRSASTYTISYTGTAGSLMLSGVAEAEGTPFTVLATDFGNLVYVPSVIGGVDSFQISFNDGEQFSAASTFTITSPTTPGPVIKPANAGVVSATRGESFSIPQLFSATDTDPNATIAQYEIELSDLGGGYGGFLLGTTAEPNDTPFYVTAAQLSTLTYVAEAGKETFSVRANDGTVAAPHWGAWLGSVTVSVPAVEVAPVLKTMTLNLIYGSTLSGSSLVSVTSNKFQITEYQFYDPLAFTAGDPAGLLEESGSLDAVFYTTDLSQVSFVANSNGISAATKIYVRAYDGAAWSNWAIDTITVTNPGPAIVSAQTGIVGANRDQIFTMDQLFGTNLPVTNASISQYEIYLSDAGGGYGGFTSNSTIEPNDQYFYVTPQAFSALSYEIEAGSETFSVRASTITSTGVQWGAWATITVTAPAETAPVLKAVTLSTLYTASIAGAQLANPVSATYPITLYEFADIPLYATGTDVAGALMSGGVTGSIFYAPDPSQVSYQTNDTGLTGKTQIEVRAYDGAAWSSWVVDTINVTNPGPTIVPATTSPISAVRGQSIQIADLFSATLPVSGASISEYEIDLSDAGGGYGGFSVGTTVEPNDQPFYVTAAQFSSLTYTILAGTETFYVRASTTTPPGAQWGAWSAAITVKAPAEGAVPVLKSVTLSELYDSTIIGSSLVSVASNNYPITQYEFYDPLAHASVDPAGALVDSGSANPLFTSDLSQVSFQTNSTGLAATAKIYIRVFDGAAWSSWAIDTINVTNPGPTIVPATTSPISAVREQSIQIADLFSATLPVSGASISEYEIDLSDAGGGYGGFSVGRTVEPNDQPFYVTAAQFSSLTYTILAGTETFYVRASTTTPPGAQWGAWSVAITVKAPAEGAMPVLKAVAPLTTLYTTSIAGSSLFSVVSYTHPITQYEFYDPLAQTSVDPAGALVDSGTVNPLITTSDPSQVSYQTNSTGIAATATIYVRAFDGAAWSNWVVDKINVTNPGPTITPISTSITANQMVPLAQLIATSLPVGDATLSQYQVEAGTGKGNFLSGPFAAPNNQSFIVNASQLSSVTYELASGSQTLYVRASTATSTGMQWGAWAGWTETATASSPNLALPTTSLNPAKTSVVSVASLLAPASQQSPAQLVFNHS